MKIDAFLIFVMGAALDIALQKFSESKAEILCAERAQH